MMVVVCETTALESDGLDSQVKSCDFAHYFMFLCCIDAIIGAGEAGCFREVAATFRDQYRVLLQS